MGVVKSKLKTSWEFELWNSGKIGGAILHGCGLNGDSNEAFGQISIIQPK